MRNETAQLKNTVPKLIAATANDLARIVWVCNGCTDNSAELVRRLAGPSANVIELERGGKTAALQHGDDALGDLFPRFYLDADTWMRPRDFSRLAEPLLSGAADLVAPRLRFDSNGASQVSARIGACWLSLPHAQTSAFSVAIGLSKAARNLWDHWPEITGDDIFVSATVPAHRKLIVPEAVATTIIPSSFAGWVRMRARWLKGEAEMARLGLALPRPDRQRLSLLRQMVSKDAALGAWAFVAARMLAEVARTDSTDSAWLPERTKKNV